MRLRTEMGMRCLRRRPPGGAHLGSAAKPADVIGRHNLVHSQVREIAKVDPICLRVLGHVRLATRRRFCLVGHLRERACEGAAGVRHAGKASIGHHDCGPTVRLQISARRMVVASNVNPP